MHQEWGHDALHIIVVKWIFGVMDDPDASGHGALHTIMVKWMFDVMNNPGAPESIIFDGKSGLSYVFLCINIKKKTKSNQILMSTGLSLLGSWTLLRLFGNISNYFVVIQYKINNSTALNWPNIIYNMITKSGMNEWKLI